MCEVAPQNTGGEFKCFDKNLYEVLGLNKNIYRFWDLQGVPPMSTCTCHFSSAVEVKILLETSSKSMYHNLQYSFIMTSSRLQ
jgi:hypothetical protein